MRPVALGLALLGTLAGLAGVPAGAAAASYAGRPSTVAGLRVPARAGTDAVELSLGGGRFARRFWPGVNLGVTVPGSDPGDLAVTRPQYDRWLAEMGRLGVRVVRVYTRMRPRFYESLAAYDRAHPRAPIRLLQGIYLDEDRLRATQDAYDPAFTASSDRAVRETVAAVHGGATIPHHPGEASGRYRTSVAPWLLGWSFGVEWDPEAVASTDARHAGTAPFAGRYVAATAAASPMESWIAARLDLLATEEARRGWSTPLTFTNWVTTDPLRHPAEPLSTEDLAAVDATHVRPTPAWPAGGFASYHVYPYYPDFLSIGAESYAGYLARLRAYHAAAGQAVMITEFGVPSSLGVAHSAPLGRDQGGHSEREAGRIDAAMLGEIRRAGMSGGVLFEWVDEWFKRTWNTQDVEQPVDRRRLWTSPLTNEEHFGVLAADPVTPRPRPAGGGLRTAVDPEALVVAVPTRAQRFVVGVDDRAGGSGSGGLPGTAGAAPDADVAVLVDGASARVDLAGTWEPTARLWPGEGIPEAAAWQPARMLLSHPLVRPDTGEQIPARVRTLGPLAVARRGGVATVRIPWALLGFADPSRHRIASVAAGHVSFATVPGVRVTVVAGRATRTSRLVRWAGWDHVRFTIRRKASWPTLRRAFAATAR